MVGQPDASAARRFLDRFTDRMSDQAIADALVHRDLGPAHVLCSGGEITGIIDWADACIGDPAIDLAWLLHGSPPPLAHALESVLDVDADLRERSLLCHRLGPWFEVEYGLEQGRDELVSSGLEGVRDRLALGSDR